MASKKIIKSIKIDFPKVIFRPIRIRQTDELRDIREAIIKLRRLR